MKSFGQYTILYAFRGIQPDIYSVFPKRVLQLEGNATVYSEDGVVSGHCQDHGVPTVISQSYCLKSGAFPAALALLQEVKRVLGQAQSEEQIT